MRLWAKVAVARRCHIAYVDQQVYLFQDTIRFKITLGQSFIDREIMAVIKGCRLVNANVLRWPAA